MMPGLEVVCEMARHRMLVFRDKQPSVSLRPPQNRRIIDTQWQIRWFANANNIEPILGPLIVAEYGV
jgi:hypothetical protein